MLVRKTLTLLLVLSLATLPIAGASGLAQKADEAVEMSAAAGGTHDCCPKEKPCDMEGCNSMSLCASHSFNLSVVGFSELIFPLPKRNIRSLTGNALLRAQTHSPPLHPPQV